MINWCKLLLWWGMNDPTHRNHHKTTNPLFLLEKGEFYNIHCKLHFARTRMTVSVYEAPVATYSWFYPEQWKHVPRECIHGPGMPYTEGQAWLFLSHVLSPERLEALQLQYELTT